MGDRCTALNVWDVLVQKLPYSAGEPLLHPAGHSVGACLRIYAALKKNRWQDHVVSTLVVVFISVPGYVYAFIVQYLFCYKLGWFPLTVESLESTAFFSLRMMRSMMPAILSLGFGVVAGLTRYTRAERRCSPASLCCSRAQRV